MRVYSERSDTQALNAGLARSRGPAISHIVLPINSPPADVVSLADAACCCTRGGLLIRRLEGTTWFQQLVLSDQIAREALLKLSDADLNLVEAIAQRGVPFSECTPEEIGALDRCLAEFEAAERMFAGAMLFDRP